MRLSLISAAAIMLASGLANAATNSNPGLVVTGSGAVSCGQYLQTRSPNGADRDTYDLMFVSWVQGYLTGSNHERMFFQKAASAGSLVEAPDPETILAYMDKHCRDNPLETVQNAAWALRLELAPKGSLSQQ